MPRLQAPPGTTHVQSLTGIYPLDAETCIEVAEGHPDVDTFLSMGFTPAASAIPRNPRGSKSAPAPEPQA